MQKLHNSNGKVMLYVFCCVISLFFNSFNFMKYVREEYFALCVQMTHGFFKIMRGEEVLDRKTKQWLRNTCMVEAVKSKGVFCK